MVQSTHNRLLSYLHHRAVDLADPLAYHILAEHLVSTNNQTSKSQSENTIALGDNVQLPFHDSIVVPDPPSFLLNSTPNYKLAFEYYLNAVKLGRSESALSAAQALNRLEESFVQNHEKDPNQDIEDIVNPQEFRPIVSEILELAIADNNTDALNYVASQAWKQANNATLVKKRSPLSNLNANETRKRKKRAIQLWMKAAQWGDLQATLALAEAAFLTDMHQDDDIFKDQDADTQFKSKMDLCIYWKEKALNLGDDKALPLLACLYRQKLMDGDTTSMNDEMSELAEKSLTLTKSAAESGDASSMLFLAIAHSERISLEREGPWTWWTNAKDDHIAIDYFLQAYDNGQEEAMMMILSILYEKWSEWMSKLKRRAKREMQQGGSKSTSKNSSVNLSRKHATQLKTFSEQFNIGSAHVDTMIGKMKTTLHENGHKIRILSRGEVQDIFKVFHKLDAMNLYSSTGSDDVSSTDESDE